MAIGLVVSSLAVRAKAIEVAESLFVELDASTYNTGDPVWTNTSGAYTNFETFGAPQRVSIATTPAIFFDGIDDAFAGEDFTPEGLVGVNPTRSIEAWVFNPSIANEETIVSWGRRGGPDGTNIAFNYGNNGQFGAVGHWNLNTFDVGWIDNDPDFTPGAPEANQWHHLVYTFDGEVTRVFSDGELWNEEETVNNWGDLVTWEDTRIAIASQWEADAVTLTPTLKGSMAIGRVRVHDGALTEDQILANYNEERALFVNPPDPGDPTPEPIPAGPVHRYSFSEAATNDAEGVVLVDSVGGANGSVVGAGASMTGSGLQLSGGPSTDAPYADLPNGILSSLTDATLEAWLTVDGSQTWSRVFDFGSTTPGDEEGELEEPGGGGNGLDYLALAVQRGDDINTQRLEIRNEDPAGGGIATVDANAATELGEPLHYTAVYDSDGSLTGEPVLRLYRDGELVGEGATTIELSELNDVNNWLGRSNWTNDANLEGTFDEFRIYDYALTTNQVLGNFQAGPDMVNIGGNPCDVNGDGSCTGADFDAVATAVRTGDTSPQFDLNGDGQVNEDDKGHWVSNLMNTWVGDADLNGEFNSGDLVNVLASGTYEADVDSGWSTGDFNGDLRTNSSDLVAALADGGYEAGPRAAVQAAVPEPATGALLISSLLGLLAAARQSRRLTP
jgi:hypothetical protein